MHKDASGWRGPTTVVHVDADHNLIYVKSQGSIILCANQDVRPADRTWYLDAHQVFSVQEDRYAPENHLLHIFHQMSVGQTVDLMAVQNREGGWLLTRHASGSYLAFKAALHLAACWFDLQGCVGGRLGRGIDRVSQLRRFRSVVWYWNGGMWSGQYRVIQPGTNLSLQS